jgi:hypothetical protein
VTSASTENTLVPSFDFTTLGAELKKDPNLDLSDVLARLATLPAAEVAKPVKAATAVELVTDKLMDAIEQLPTVFGKVKPPKARRLLNSTELYKLRAEKVQIDAAQGALKKRKAEIHSMISVHFDVYAETHLKIDPEKTPRDKDGHYLIASAGNPETALVKDGDKHFKRQKTKDQAVWSMEKLLDLYEKGEITRAEFLAMTSQTRVLDEDKIKRLLTLPSKMHRIQEIITKITEVQYGTLSIRLG